MLAHTSLPVHPYTDAEESSQSGSHVPHEQSHPSLAPKYETSQCQSLRSGGEGGGLGGGGLGGGGLGGGDGIRYHALGGPSVDDVPSERAYDASHADALINIRPMSVTELVSHPEMSALNDDA